jgi:hypothetical protein
MPPTAALVSTTEDNSQGVDMFLETDQNAFSTDKHGMDTFTKALLAVSGISEGNWDQNNSHFHAADDDGSGDDGGDNGDGADGSLGDAADDGGYDGDNGDGADGSFGDDADDGGILESQVESEFLYMTSNEKSTTTADQNYVYVYVGASTSGILVAGVMLARYTIIRAIFRRRRWNRDGDGHFSDVLPSDSVAQLL